MVRSEVKDLRRQEANRYRFDKIAWSNFERAKHGPKGVGQEARSTKSSGTILNISVVVFIRAG